MSNTIRAFGHLWTTTDKPSRLGADYIILRRKHWKSDFKKNGLVVMEIDYNIAKAE